MNNIEIYEMLLELIDKKASAMNITESKLNRYYIPEGIELNQNYLERLASSLQNSGMMHNSIRFNESEERYNHIKEVLCDFDCQKVLDKYKSWEELYAALTNDGKLDNGTKKDTEEKRTNWGKYAKGLYEGAVFLENDGGNKQIEALCKEPLTADELNGKIKELREIKRNIHGLGFALTCDWLKECGCYWLAKPDIHIKVVCSEIEGKHENILMSDEAVIKFMFNFSNIVKDKYPDVTPYKLDKIIWLICTGNFYLEKDKIGRDTILRRLKD